MKLFQGVPYKRLVLEDKTYVYALGDVYDCYTKYEYKDDNIHFKAHYKKVNDYWVAYSLKFNSKVKTMATSSYAIILNNKTVTLPTKLKVLYQDKVVRFACFSGATAKDFIFAVKNSANIIEDEEDADNES